jgi:muramidase (phage lysozyme)
MVRYEVEKKNDAVADFVETLKLEEKQEEALLTLIGEVEQAINKLDATWGDECNEVNKENKRLKELLAGKLSNQEILDLKFEGVVLENNRVL